MALFHCPGDIRDTLPTGSGYAYDSYSKTQNYAGDPYDDYWKMGATCSRTSNVNSPSMTFVFVEDTDWRGYDVGTWVVNWKTDGFTWQDPLAMSHLNVNTWAFAERAM